MNGEQKINIIESMILRSQLIDILLEELYVDRWKNRFAKNFDVIKTVEVFETVYSNGTRARVFWWYIPYQGWGCLRQIPNPDNVNDRLNMFPVLERVGERYTDEEIDLFFNDYTSWLNRNLVR